MPAAAIRERPTYVSLKESNSAMATPLERRYIRLANDYKQMVNLRSQGNMISWTALKGTEPYIESYAVTVRVRSLIRGGTQNRDEHTVSVDLPADYPTSPPRIVMTSSPPVFHPNWFTNAQWCFGTWTPAESLGHHIVRMVQTLQYDPDITNPHSPANQEAKDWYLRMLRVNPSRFPCDRQPLPDPTKTTGFVVKPKKTFDIRGS
jgi:ubiquitin-protein ligase